jgi:ABC-type lipoprotein release transport system permease subunit
MIISIAWKNIWRNTQRSLVLVAAVFVGIWSLLFILGWMEGMSNAYIDQTIKRKTSHIQIHHPEFAENMDPKFGFEQRRINVVAENHPSISHFAKRTKTTAMINSSSTSRGVQWYGIIPDQENNLSGMRSWLVEGELFPVKMRNPIVIGKRMSERLKVGVGQKVVLNFQTAAGDISAAACRVSGIIETGDANIDDLIVFSRLSDAQRLLTLPDGIIHEVAILADEIEGVTDLNRQLQVEMDDLSVESYKELAPELELFQSSIELNSYIMAGIFMLTLIFGIVNTMLMAILERTKELGMLMAIGMGRNRIFTLVVVETVMTSIIAAPFGLLAGYLTMQYLSERGINLARWSEGLREFGMEPVVYPSLTTDYYLLVVIAIGTTAIIASLYPAIKAIRLNPIEAMRKI